jgi:hypothetical protein
MQTSNLDQDPGDWHKVHDEDYDDAVMRASGAMVGYTAGKGERLQWTLVVREAFLAAVTEAFNRGFETGRVSDVAAC